MAVSPDSVDLAAGAGALLRRARERQGLDEDDIIQRIGLPRRTLRALEADDYAALPALVYVRGYLRTYCDILGLRPSPVLACFDDHHTAWMQARQPAPVVPGRKPSGAAIAALAASLMACSLVTWALYSDSVELPLWREPAGAARSIASQGQAPEISAGQLVFEFHADSWLQVIDANDHILAVDLYREGERLDLEGKAPFRVSLGHAPGVVVLFRGEAVALEPDPESLAAEVTVGQ